MMSSQRLVGSTERVRLRIRSAGASTPALAHSAGANCWAASWTVCAMRSASRSAISASKRPSAKDSSKVPAKPPGAEWVCVAVKYSAARVQPAGDSRRATVFASHELTSKRSGAITATRWCPLSRTTTLMNTDHTPGVDSPGRVRSSWRVVAGQVGKVAHGTPTLSGPTGNAWADDGIRHRLPTCLDRRRRRGLGIPARAQRRRRTEGGTSTARHAVGVAGPPDVFGVGIVPGG